MYQTRWINRIDVSQYCITAVFTSPFEMHDILIRSFFPDVYLFYDGKLFFFVICFISRLKLNFLCKWRTLSKICINLKKMGCCLRIIIKLAILLSRNTRKASNTKGKSTHRISPKYDNFSGKQDCFVT